MELYDKAISFAASFPPLFPSLPSVWLSKACMDAGGIAHPLFGPQQFQIIHSSSRNRSHLFCFVTALQDGL
jgi:hypothetical protein